MDKPWGGRFSEPTKSTVETFTASIPFDWRLYRHDIAGSVAHCKALAEAKLIAPAERDQIVSGLKAIEADIAAGKFAFSIAHEDIHMNVERALTERIGPVAGKLHTGRSRNDQVALDMRLYVREEIDALIDLVRGVQKALAEAASRHLDVILPGYTHLQRAQPVLLAHHLLAYYEMLLRDAERLRDARNRVNRMPLGSGALAGTNYPINRELVAEYLDFPIATRNSLDAVSDRDFVIESLAACALIMAHLSRFAEELVIWSTSEFGFIELPDGFCTGSSMMPQKKNPDVPELIRGKTGRVYGSLMALLTTVKALPLAYNKDMQEDKEPLFDAVDTVKACLAITAEMIPGIRFKTDAMTAAASDSFLLATELADALALKGLPFREAHEVVGKLVRYCIETKQPLTQLSLDEFRRFSPLIDAAMVAGLTPQAAIARKSQIGGTAREAVQQRLKELEKGGRRGG
ncbi:MAG TPA: argininosuccinate lyase [Nitrospiria bacterium]|nr:argininosuccinate lyase [Nitrospiria bacterium]